MGKGIAAGFKKLYPKMFKEYRQLCEEEKFTVGKLFVYRTNNKVIINFPTKEDWRLPSKIEYIEKGLDRFIEQYQEFGITSVSFPQLGCGHGELNWSIVQALMEERLGRLPIPVFIHIFSVGPNFLPEHKDPEYAREVKLERQRVSIDAFWNDLKSIEPHESGLIKQLSLLDSSVFINDRYLEVIEQSHEPLRISREEIEDLWNILRIRGTLQVDDIQKYASRESDVDILFDLLTKLDYVKEVSLRTQNQTGFQKGLRYDPKPISPAPKMKDIVIG